MQMWWLWLLIIVLLLIMVVVFSKIHIQLFFKKIDDNEHLIVDLSGLFKLIHREIEIPVILFKGLQEGILFKEGSKPTSNNIDTDKKLKLTRHTLQRAWKNRKALLAHTADYKQWMTKTLTRVHCTQVRWHTELGTNDAAQTAICVGGVWAIKTMLFRLLFQHVQLDAKPDLAVNPMYNIPQFSTEAAVKMYIRTGWTLLAVFLLLLRILRIKGGIQTWRRIIFRPSH